MRKLMSCLLAATIMLSASCFSFATENRPMPTEIGSNFINTLSVVFDSSKESSVYDISGEEITDAFVEAYKDAYRAKDYLSIWNFAVNNISSITTKEYLSRRGEIGQLGNWIYTPQANRTIKVQETKNFIDTNLYSSGERATLYFSIVVKGQYTENPNTGKILSATTTSAEMKYDPPVSQSQYTWDITPKTDHRGASHTDYSATFVGKISFKAKCTYAGGIYESESYRHEFTRYSE